MTAGRRAAIGVLAVFLATGCGGDDGGGSAVTAWAGDVCSSITSWTDSVSSAVGSLEGGGNLTEDNLRLAVEDVDGATSDFVDQIRELDAPEADAGEQAKESLDKLAEDVEMNVARIEEAVGNASGAGGVFEAMTTVSETLSTIGTQLSSTFTTIEQLDTGGELEEAFRAASACDDLTPGAS